MRTRLSLAMCLLLTIWCAPGASSAAAPDLYAFKAAESRFEWWRVPELKGKPRLVMRFDTKPMHVAWRHDGQRALVVCEGPASGTELFWDFTFPKGERRPLVPPTGTLMAIGFDPSGRAMMLIKEDIPPVDLQAEVIMFQGRRYPVEATGDMHPILVSAYREDGNGWKRVERHALREASEGVPSQLSRSFRTWDAVKMSDWDRDPYRMGDYREDVVEDPALGRKLDAFLEHPSLRYANRDRWSRRTWPGGVFFLLLDHEGHGYLTTGPVIRLVQGRLRPLAETSRTSHVIDQNGAHLLTRQSARWPDEPTYRVYDLEDGGLKAKLNGYYRVGFWAPPGR